MKRVQRQSTLVHLVGIGPGSPGLLTLRAADVIRRADAVRHPRSVDAAILGLARPGASIDRYRDEDEVVELAKQGERVAVLFFGDPFVLGEASPLAERLHREGLLFDIVPGVLPEAAGPSLSGIAVDVVGPSADVDATRAVRVSSGSLRRVVSRLIESGEPDDRPAALIFNPGGAGQHRVVAPLRHLAGEAAEGIQGDTLLVVGRGVEASGRLDTLARRPLHGRRILVTRARQQAEELHRHLADLGAWVVDIPTIEVRPTPVNDRIRRALELLPETGLVVFASANAVEILFEMLFEVSLDARALRSSSICAIGPETARTLESHGLRPELVVGEYTAEDLAGALGNWDLEGMRILVPRARENRDSLPQLLAKRGAEVEMLHVYELAAPAGCDKALRRLFAEERVDVATFTSSATVTNFATALGPEGLNRSLETTAVACMGPVTAQTAREVGMRVDIIAEEYTTRGLAHAIAAHFTS